jgi:predicted dehydrogenase
VKRHGYSPVVRRECCCGFPPCMEHFIDCVLHDKQPLVTGEDGRAALVVSAASRPST